MSETRMETVAGLSSAGTKTMNSDELYRVEQGTEVRLEDRQTSVQFDPYRSQWGLFLANESHRDMHSCREMGIKIQWRKKCGDF